MDDSNRVSDRFSSEPPQSQEHPVQRTDTQLRDSPEPEFAPPANGDALKSAGPMPPQVDPYAEQVNTVVSSEIGVQTLLNRLKQSIASAKEFAVFLKKRSVLEEEHANGLRKISRLTHDNLRRPEHRQGSFSQSYDDITRIHDRMADNGIQFATSLHQMHEDLLEMAANVERGRKHWKQTGLTCEQRLVDTEGAMRKSKAKYDAIAEDYDRTRTGDRQGGKIFGIKGPKSAAQHEEDLLRKVQAADADYAAKVQNAQVARSEIWSRARPETSKNLQDLIKECDSALTLQMQKFATFNEKLLLHNGMSVSPMNDQLEDQGGEFRSLRDAISSIDNEKDLNMYLGSYVSRVPPKPTEIKYERNAVLNSSAHMGTSPTVQRQSETPQSFSSRLGPQSNFAASSPTYGGSPTTQSPLTQNQYQGNQASQGPRGSQGYQGQPPPMQQYPTAQQPQQQQQHERSFSQGPPPPQPSHYNTGSLGARNGPQHGYNSGSIGSSGPPQLSNLPFQTANNAPLSTSFQNNPQQNPASTPPPLAMAKAVNLPPLKPVFGLTLEQLFDRDGSAVPMVVYQCIQAVDLFGLEVEGIYRLSGTSSHISKIKAMFDNDASKVDFRNPENFFHDVNSVAGLLKQFFRDLPDPLLTHECYDRFIEAAKHDDDIVRRDSLHAIINSLPDPNYATLRAMTLHLNRVVEAAGVNRMSASNLAIVFGPTLLGGGRDISDSGWQSRVIDTILNNCYQIFDDD